METWKNIGTVVQERIAHARQLLDTSAQEQQRFGILIPYKTETQNQLPTPRAAQAQQTLGNLSTREQEQYSFIASLKERNLNPLAVLPTSVFNRLCYRWCYRFEHLNQKSGCSIESEMLMRTACWAVGLLAATSFLTALHLLTLSMRVAQAAPNGGNGIICFFCAVVLIVFTVLTLAEGITRESLLAKPLTINSMTWCLVRWLPKRLLFRLLWPGKHDVQGRLNVTISFAEVDDNFRQALLRLEQAGLQPMIAAVPGAIGLSRQQILTSVKQAQQQEEARLTELARKRDPILYHTSGNWTAVFAQSGKFASEKRIMRAAQKYAPLAI